MANTLMPAAINFQTFPSFPPRINVETLIANQATMMGKISPMSLMILMSNLLKISERNSTSDGGWAKAGVADKVKSEMPSMMRMSDFMLLLLNFGIRAGYTCDGRRTSSLNCRSGMFCQQRLDSFAHDHSGEVDIAVNQRLKSLLRFPGIIGNCAFIRKHEPCYFLGDDYRNIRSEDNGLPVDNFVEELNIFFF